VTEIRTWAESLYASVERVFYGKHEVVEKLLVALLCRGHVLLEDVPGVGKTILARALAASIGGSFTRIQCTPDLLPADVLGVSVFNPKEGTFAFRKGPIVANIVLVDEINRATPRTQSALLEAMGETQISIEGKRFALPEPFFLIATENPVEFEGTFPLPEAQKDRFLLSLGIGYPERDVEAEIMESQRRTSHPVTDLTPVTSVEKILELQRDTVTVHVDRTVKDYMLDLVAETRSDVHFSLGVSPRGTLALYKSCQALAALRGRDYVVPEDVKELAPRVFAKRVMVKPEYLIKGHTPERLLESILDRLPVPILKDRV
jgi:MoxR-like ATPase